MWLVPVLQQVFSRFTFSSVSYHLSVHSDYTCTLETSKNVFIHSKEINDAFNVRSRVHGIHGRRRQHAIIFVLCFKSTHDTTWYQSRKVKKHKRRDIKTKTGVVIMWLELNWFCVYVCVYKKKEFPLENRMLYILW